MIRFRRTPITLNKPPAEDVDQLRASRDSWRALAEQLGRRNEELETQVTYLRARRAFDDSPDLEAVVQRLADTEAALERARMVQMADYSTGRTPI